MGHYQGRIAEIRLDAGRQMEAFVACPVEAIPRAGQYLQASNRDETEEALGVALFVTEKQPQGFWAAPPIPNSWKPGTTLNLVGPLGHGFELPREVQRLGMIALGDTIMRLLPLMEQLHQSRAGITLFTDLPLLRIPTFPEAYPLTSLVEALDWPDFLVIDLPLQRLFELRNIFGLPDGFGLNCPVQVLVTLPMPCAGLARCGACAVPAWRGWKLACQDGPVFDLNYLKW